MPAAPATSDDHKKEGNELFAKGDFLRAAAAYTLGAPPRKWLCWCCDRRGPTRLADPEPGAELKAAGVV